MFPSFANEYEYLHLLDYILKAGRVRGDRTGTGTKGIFGAQMRFDLTNTFPLLTTKKMFFRGIKEELLWILRGETNVKSLQDKGVHIWDEWATKEKCAVFGREEGDLGPVYGHQWRNFGAQEGTLSHETPYGTVNYGNPNGVWENDGFDQIKWVAEEIKKNPNSRRLIVTGWNPAEATQVALPPCHTLFQFYVQDGFLDCQLYQRSGDMFLGVPFNIASYSLLTCLMARHCGLKPGTFVHTLGDAHIYLNHIDQVKEQLSRAPYSGPRLKLPEKVESLFTIDADSIIIEEYSSWPSIVGQVAI